MARLGREDALPSGESRSAGAIPSRLLWFPRGRSNTMVSGKRCQSVRWNRQIWSEVYEERLLDPELVRQTGSRPLISCSCS